MNTESQTQPQPQVQVQSVSTSTSASKSQTQTQTQSQLHPQPQPSEHTTHPPTLHRELAKYLQCFDAGCARWVDPSIHFFLIVPLRPSIIPFPLAPFTLPDVFSPDRIPRRIAHIFVRRSNTSDLNVPLLQSIPLPLPLRSLLLLIIPQPSSRLTDSIIFLFSLQESATVLRDELAATRRREDVLVDVMNELRAALVLSFPYPPDMGMVDEAVRGPFFLWFGLWRGCFSFALKLKFELVLVLELPFLAFPHCAVACSAFCI